MIARDLRGLLPHEHGSWAYLLGPQLAALLAARAPVPTLLWLAGSLLLFCSFQGFAAAFRRKEIVSIAGGIAGVTGLAVVLAAAGARPIALWSFAPATLTALLGIFWKRGRLGRQSLLEVLGILSLSAQGGAGLFLGGGTWRAALLLSLISAAYFLLSLIWVRVRLAGELPGRSPLLPHGWNIPASLLILMGSAIAGLVTGGLLAGLLPGLYLGRSLLPVPRRGDGRLRIPAFGVQEAVVASIFAVGLGLFLPT